MQCGRCRITVTLGGEERCWLCHAPLCGDCWEECGHCEHPEAHEMNARFRAHDYRAQDGRTMTHAWRWGEGAF